MTPPSVLEQLRSQYPEMDEREARGRIMRGDVLVGTARVTKPGMRLPEGTSVTLAARRRFASRAGEKLEGALERLGLSVAGKTLVDAGSSTGGFTDCLLARGAAAVYSVDVGRNQLAWRLRRDPRVRVLEGTNVMDLDTASFPIPPQGAVCDLSFRSIRRAAARLVGLVSEGWLLALVKPQFEWSEPPGGFRGVVRGEADLLRILCSLVRDLEEEGLVVRSVCPSVLPGRRGNREFFYVVGAAGSGPAIRIPEELEAILGERLPG
jgi:23S rRNA (cytidine1920-2'-O)/16S rRNA (cytidine1409-2'-O)-methyltransferase